MVFAVGTSGSYRTAFADAGLPARDTGIRLADRHGAQQCQVEVDSAEWVTSIEYPPDPLSPLWTTGLPTTAKTPETSVITTAWRTASAEWPTTAANPMSRGVTTCRVTTLAV